MTPNTNPSINLRNRKITDEDYSAGKSIEKVVIDDELYKKIVSIIKKIRPRLLTEEDRLDNILLQGHIRHEYEEDKKKHGPDRPVKAPQLSRKVTKSLRWDEQLVKSIWSDFSPTESINNNVLVAGNKAAKCGVIPDCRNVKSLL